MNPNNSGANQLDDGELEKEIVKTIKKSLESFGFIGAKRKCYTPKHGEGAYVEEDWSAETVGAFVADDVARLINHHTKEANKALLDRLESKAEAVARSDKIDNTINIIMAKAVPLEALKKERKRHAKQ